MSFHSWKSVCLPKAAELWKQSLYWGREEIMQRINSLSHLENVCDNDIVCFYLTVKKTPPKQNKKKPSKLARFLVPTSITAVLRRDASVQPKCWKPSVSVDCFSIFTRLYLLFFHLSCSCVS